MATSIRSSSPAWRAWRWLAVAAACLGLSSAPSAGSPDGSVPTAVRPVPQIEPIRPIPSPEPMDAARIDLGRSLFEDPRLSHGGDRSCSSCHDTASNGADARARDSGPDGQAIRTNTNTVFNAALSFRLDWIGDAHSLEEQAAGSLQRSDLMATTPDEVTRKLAADPARASAFRQAYDGRDPNWADVLDALATYEKTLVTPDSRFDLWLQGQADAISSDELAGYRLFKSAGCASCHQGANVGGNLFESNGIFGQLLNRHTFTMRVPSLRNVAVTPPYFHDGSVADLGEAVQMMARAQLGRRFTDAETGQIVAFLGSLTGRYQGRPLTKAGP
ncbi:MAG: cytochrome-c peroxidase [Janthinobacterium lividum]